KSKLQSTEVWAYYDPKGTGVIPKKVLEKFFKVSFRWLTKFDLTNSFENKDSLDLYALRKGAKSSKEIIAPGVKMADAMAASVQKVMKSVYVCAWCVCVCVWCGCGCGCGCVGGVTLILPSM